MGHIFERLPTNKLSFDGPKILRSKLAGSVQEVTPAMHQKMIIFKSLHTSRFLAFHAFQLIMAGRDFPIRPFFIPTLVNIRDILPFCAFRTHIWIKINADDDGVRMMMMMMMMTMTIITIAKHSSKHTVPVSFSEKWNIWAKISKLLTRGSAPWPNMSCLTVDSNIYLLGKRPLLVVMSAFPKPTTSSWWFTLASPPRYYIYGQY